MPKLPDIHLPTSLKDRLAQGHPWVYRNNLPPGPRMRSGSWVRARCGGWSGYGLWDDTGPIALRIFSERQIPDAGWLRERVWAAWELRAPLRESGVTAHRWLFGEGDGLPGLTVDLYGDWAVVQTYMDGAETLLGWLATALREIASLRGIVLRGREQELAAPRTESQEPRTENQEPRTIIVGRRSSVVGRRPSVLWGESPPRELVVEEYGLRFYADLGMGQKTGLFLDQRENRRFVEGLSYGCEVLNCFAYTGAFSLYALRGGARAVVSADIGRGLA